MAWSFPTANEQEAAHNEWTVKDILAHIGRDMATIQSKIRLFLERRRSPSNDTDIKAFLDKRPDGVAFDETTIFLESLSPRIHEGDGL